MRIFDFSKYRYFNKIAFAMSLILSLILNSCYNDEIPQDAYYTFKGETIGEYITNRSEDYSEFGKLLEMTGVMGLLKAYGKYTCFLPTNEAMKEFYKSRGKNSLNDFDPDSLKKVAYEHIIKNYVVSSEQFVDGLIPYLTMSSRFVKITIKPGTNVLLYYVNDNSLIEIKDIELHNGIIHTINKVLSPTEKTIVEVIAANNKFSIFYQALIETNLYQKLAFIKDNNYKPPESLLTYEGKYTGIGSIIRIPKEKKYGFTVLMESDETYSKYGIYNLEDLKNFAKQIYDQIYPEDANVIDITDSRNSLNRFIAYHLINKKLTSKFFIEKYDNTGRYYNTTGETHSIKSVDMFEYIETMCPNTLIEVRTLRKTNEYNVFNMIEETGKAIRLTDDFDNDALNGVYHEIDDILAYTREVDRMLSSKRLRMDAASFFPELTNNNIRVGHATVDYPSEFWMFPQGYIERLKTSENTQFSYFNADDRFCDYQGDEVFLSGLYDFEIVTPPIPAGTYEIRFGYQPTHNRGAAQLYWDGKPTGIPLDLRILADDPKIGYVQPGTDPSDPDGYENDKMMRNRGYMKAPASFKVINTAWYSGSSARMTRSAIRRILGLYTFEKAGHHTFTVKAVRGGEFMFDYLEFVPVEVLEYEDIY